jgi:ATP-binding cassette, subfamily B, bacterial
VQLLAAVAMLALIDWRMFGVVVVAALVLYLLHRAWVTHIRTLYRDIHATRQGIDGDTTEVFGGMRIIRCFGRQRRETSRFVRANHLMTRLEMRAWWWLRGVDVVWGILIPLAAAALLWYGGGRVLSDLQRVGEGVLAPQQALSVGDLVMFLGYMMALLGPVSVLSQRAATVQNDLAGMERAMDQLAEPPELPSPPGARAIPRASVQGRITLRDVSFVYPGCAVPTLRGIDLDIAAGEMIALVGPSGAGKTTLCNLIARFHDPTGGVIELDGVDLRAIELGSYRRLLGIVEQDTFLFDGTVAQNIAYGRRDATMQQIVEAARQADAHSFIMALGLGYDTRIGERGIRLSGGQRQRLTIARAILADPRILILDEATSNLDARSEQLVQEGLRALMNRRTSLVIAHRLSTILHADRIIYIEDGRIIDQGPHQALLARCRRYRQMVRLQLASRDAAGPGVDECEDLTEA